MSTSAPAEVAEWYFHWLSAPATELIWFERSAHLPNSKERTVHGRSGTAHREGLGTSIVAAGYGVRFLP